MLSRTLAHVVVFAATIATVSDAQAVRKSEAETSSTTVLLVRHTEKESQPADDPALTAVGRQRAQRLAHALRDAGLDAIMTTHLQRSTLTAQPIADQLGITPTIVRAGGADHPQRVVQTLRERYAGRTVLVVGHSNTIPEIVRALGAPHPGAIADSTHDDLFVVTLDPTGRARLVRAKY